MFGRFICLYYLATKLRDMKSKEEIENRIKLSEKSLVKVLKDIKENDSFEFHDLLIDRKISEETLIKTLKWVLNA